MPARRNPARTKAPSPARPRAAPAARAAARPRDEGVELARRLGLADVPPWAGYVHRGRRECAFSQLKLLGRIVNTIYDQALEPVGLRASQLALMWAIVAMEPVDMTTLGATIHTDQTTLSRTVETLRRARLVGVRPGADRRTRIVSATALGRRRFVQAMPYWEEAQRRAAALLSLDEVKMLARQVRHATRIPA